MEPLTADGEQDPGAMEAARRATADRIRAAAGDRAAVAAAVDQFLDFGDAGEYSPAELWDHFAAAPPTVPELAGCDAAAADRVVRVFAARTNARYGDGRPLPADWPWREEGPPPCTRRRIGHAGAMHWLLVLLAATAGGAVTGGVGMLAYCEVGREGGGFNPCPFYALLLGAPWGAVLGLVSGVARLVQRGTREPKP
ncbi:hypothetical protein J0H58_03050 [bacterium]|nr:hypothetical protein [bacterium]